jgi:2,3-bisphosphoglycerate-independent phosphoglycerate mutase
MMPKSFYCYFCVMTRKTLLLILDGWGEGKLYAGNAIALANTPNFDRLKKQYPSSLLKTSGEDVGLPNGQMGNSEVGHMNIGAGRVVYQQLVLINKAFRDKSIFSNTVLQHAIAHANQHQSDIHLMGLVSDGGVHSSIEHLKGLCSLMQNNGVKKFYVHAFTDGRDTDPKGGVVYLTDLLQVLQYTGGNLASITGRYYAMDRDKRWERIKIAYDALVNGTGTLSYNPVATLQQRYNEGETDEFIKPIIATNETDKPMAVIKPNDVVICFNFRTDRGREITEALTQTDFHEYNMHRLDIHYVTLTEYDKSFSNIGVVFPDLDLTMTLGEVLEKNGLTQARIAETEKYPHVTFFFSGGREIPFVGEKRHLAPSPKVATYDLQPEMSADLVCNFALEEIVSENSNFICVNFANPDMVGHTGVLQAEIKAIEKVDECLGKLIDKALSHGYDTLITADHGNGEFMINDDGSPNTAHTTNEVPLIFVSAKNKNFLKNGRLADLAPTIVELLEIPKPLEMTGESLLISNQ